MVLVHLVLISAQVGTRSGSTVLQAIVFGTFAEVQRATAWATGGVVRAWNGYVDLRGVAVEKERLRQELAQLQVKLQTEHALARRGERLQLLLTLQDAVPQKTIVADVIAADASPWFRTLTVARGTRDGVGKDMAVISPSGVVGRISDPPAAHASRVQLIVDHNAGIGALIERSRVGGVVVADAGRRGLRLEYVPTLADVRAGDVVITSGLDGIYPKGFVIGRVTRVDQGGNGYAFIRVAPSVDFSSLEEVLIVLDPPRATTGEGGE